MRDLDLLADLHRRGLCCVQAMVYMGLEHLRRDNPLLLQVASGLCKGMRSGLACGALTGGICMLGMFGDSTHSNSVMVPELVEWFVNEYGQDGNISCKYLIEEDMDNYDDLCPNIMENTYLKAKEILRENGFEICDELPD